MAGSNHFEKIKCFDLKSREMQEKPVSFRMLGPFIIIQNQSFYATHLGLICMSLVLL
jgi:hypothetical protein